MQNSKYNFTLNISDSTKILNKFNIKITNTPLTSPQIKTNITTLNELHTNNNIQQISFLDESKKIKNCFVLMLNQNMENIQNQKADCFWCNHPFDTIPIGCPVKYTPNLAIKSYYSEISKDNYVIKENITDNRAHIIEKSDMKLEIIKNGYFETDGVFCSFNCCKSYIKENIHNTLYQNSELLLLKLYNKLFNTQIIEIKSAPHWRLLKKYGGTLNIESFRNDFNKIEYIYHGTIKNLYKPIGQIFEEKLKI